MRLDSLSVINECHASFPMHEAMDDDLNQLNNIDITTASGSSEVKKKQQPSTTKSRRSRGKKKQPKQHLSLCKNSSNIVLNDNDDDTDEKNLNNNSTNARRETSATLADTHSESEKNLNTDDAGRRRRSASGWTAPPSEGGVGGGRGRGEGGVVFGVCDSMANMAGTNGTSNKGKSVSKRSSGSGSTKEAVNENATGGRGGRERKRKFDVKKLLNLRGPAEKQQSNGKDADGGVVNDTDTDMSLKTRRSGRVKATHEAQSASPATSQINGTRGSSPESGSTGNKNSKSPGEVSEPKMSSDNVALGKRERKRKKFWDEREANESSVSPPPSKVSKKSGSEKKPSTPLTTTKVKSAMATGGNVNSSQSKKDRKASLNLNNTKTEGQLASSKGGNGKVLKYLLFDMAQEPVDIANQMVEGENIPGPGAPIPIDSSSLPSGWEKQVVQRGMGLTKGKWDVFIKSPTGKCFRSKNELQRHFEDQKIPFKQDSFDFSLDDNLKRLRQIWKQHIYLPKQRLEEASAAAEGMTNSTTSSTVTSSKSISTTLPTLPGNRVSNLSSELDHINTEPSIDMCTSATAADVGVESETGQGIRCSIDKCGKLFRNDKLHQMHIKHYHPHVFGTLQGTSQSVTELAQSRTLLSDELTLNSHPPDELSAFISSVTSPSNSAEDHKKSALSGTNQAVCSETTCSPTQTNSSKKKKSTSDNFEKEKRLKTECNSTLTSSKRSSAKTSSSSSRRLSAGEEDKINRHATFKHDDNCGRQDSISTANGDPNYDLDDVFNSHNGGPVLSSPSTPPTFRVSKRRQAQLKKKALARGSRVDAFFADDASLSGDNGTLEVGGPGIEGISGSAPPSYPPSEMDASVASEHLTHEEVVNCKCKRIEEDGLMIQCDICLCWQHGVCLGLDEEDQVPNKYICEICRDPPGGRPSSLHAIDQDWLKEGKFTSVILPPPRTRRRSSGSRQQHRQQPQDQSVQEVAFKRLSELMADLSNLNKVLHALRVKLHVASQSNNSKVFMWSAPWERQIEEQIITNLNDQSTSESKFESNLNHSATQHKHPMSSFPSLNTSHHSEPPSQTSTDISTSTISTAPSVSTENHKGSEEVEKISSTDSVPNGNHVEETTNDLESNHGCTSELGEKTKQIQVDQENGPVLNESRKENGSILSEETSEGTNDPESHNTTLNHDGVEDVPPELENLDPSMIPSVSEVERLLPSILQESLAAECQLGSDGLAKVAPELQQHAQASLPPPPPVIIPEQKRIDKDECRLNLLSHIEKIQSDVTEVLDKIERSLTRLETGEESLSAVLSTSDGLSSRIKAIAVKLLQDLALGRKLIGAV